MSAVRWRRKKGTDNIKDRERRKNKGARERGKKIEGQLVWRMRETGKGREGRRIEREDERWRDMAHLLLLSGCCEIAGFPRSANCGSEFFPCLSPLTPSLPPPLSLSLALSPSPSSSLSLPSLPCH